jgi:uncharacterized protein with ParB-like and HNH nuclease domain
MPAISQLIQQNNTVNELIDMYSKGVIAIPEIQRDFVWDAQRIKLLLDSYLFSVQFSSMPSTSAKEPGKSIPLAIDKRQRVKYSN